MKIKNWKQFNEMASYNETMSILDLIYVLENKDQSLPIIQIDQHGDSEKNRFFIDGFVKIPSEGKDMENKDYYHSFDGDKYDFYTYKGTESYGVVLGFDVERPEHPTVNFKTVGDLLKEVKQIPNPEKSLFFMRDVKTLYEAGTKDTAFAAPMGLGNYNIESYPLALDGEIVTGQLMDAYTFMYESKGRYYLRDKY
jgi:hypothetical protein